MELLYRLMVGIFGLWMIGVSILILVRPKMMLQALRKMASTNFINYTELGLRLLVGLAVVGLAPYTAYTKLLHICGGFLAVTAIILMLIPRRWHHAYSVWWADKLKPWQVQIATPLSFAIGAAALWLVVN
jgi:hypothetical protein